MLATQLVGDARKVPWWALSLSVALTGAGARRRDRRKTAQHNTQPWQNADSSEGVGCLAGVARKGRPVNER